MEVDDVLTRVRDGDPAVGLRAVGALHRLAEQVECAAVGAARAQGWSWEQIGDALGVSRQSAHAKHGSRSGREGHADDGGDEQEEPR